MIDQLRRFLRFKLDVIWYDRRKMLDELDLDNVTDANENIDALIKRLRGGVGS